MCSVLDRGARGAYGVWLETPGDGTTWSSVGELRIWESFAYGWWLELCDQIGLFRPDLVA